ncbi:unnamed protein product, partial [Phaeothamnion confervicola]
GRLLRPRRASGRGDDVCSQHWSRLPASEAASHQPPGAVLPDRSRPAGHPGDQPRRPARGDGPGRDTPHPDRALVRRARWWRGGVDLLPARPRGRRSSTDP